MTRSSDYCYMDEDSISPYLKCSFCSKPFVDPVITDDGSRSCRACTSSDNVTPLKEKLILDMLDHLRIECIKCHEKNIRRGDYKQHNDTKCSQRIVLCKASDLKCSWTDTYAELDQHLKSCPFEVLRPIFTEILAKIGQDQTRRSNEQQEVRNENKEYEEFKTEVEHLRKERIELENAIHQITNQSENILGNQIEQLNKLYHEQIKRNNELEAETKRLRILFLQHFPVLKKFQAEFEQYKQSINIQQLKEQLEQLQFETRRISEQLTTIPAPAPIDNSNEITYMKQLFNQHDVQIKLLARKKCVIPAVNAHTDPELEKYIDKFLNNSEIDLDGKQLTDHDADIICKKAIMEKKCSKLRLQKNKITGKGATILANALYNNTTLIELYLSKNQISDIGVHALAQTLVVNSSKLKVLDLYSNNITDEGIEYLSDMLKINKTITRLGLGFNQITDHGIRLLANAIIYFNDNLQYLSFSSNKLITDKSLSSLIEMLTCNSSLTTLWLNDCSLSPTAVVRLKEEAKNNENFTLEV